MLPWWCVPMCQLSVRGDASVQTRRKDRAGQQNADRCIKPPSHTSDCSCLKILHSLLFSSSRDPIPSPQISELFRSLQMWWVILPVCLLSEMASVWCVQSQQLKHHPFFFSDSPWDCAALKYKIYQATSTEFLNLRVLPRRMSFKINENNALSSTVVNYANDGELGWF